MPEPLWRAKAEALAEDLAADVAAGRLQVGDRLPIYIDLARAYGVAVGTIRQSVDLLRELGIVEVRRSVGLYLTQVPALPLDAPTTAPRRRSAMELVEALTARVAALETEVQRATEAHREGRCDGHLRGVGVLPSSLDPH